MKKINLMVVAVLATFISTAQTVSTFENLTLPSDTFWDGSDGTGLFSSGNAEFVNGYNFFINDFGYSNMTDTVTAGFTNAFSSSNGSGYNGSTNFAVAYVSSNTKIRLTGAASGKLVEGAYLTNNTYAYKSMKTGDTFAKKFGGTTGNDPDYFKLIIKGWLNGTAVANEVEFYLADFRFADNAQDYIVRDWTWVNLLPLGNVDSLQFFIESSDTGQFGINTPTYFCLDNFTTADVLNVVPVAVNDTTATPYNQAVSISVLANDVDNTANPLTVTLVGSPLIPGATASVVANVIEYTPATGVVATDTLNYQVCDVAGLCATARVLVDVTGITSLDEIGESTFIVYPNPFQNELTIESNSAMSDLRLFNMLGAIVFEQKNISNNIIRVSLSNLPKGVYQMQMISGSNSIVKSLIKQ